MKKKIRAWTASRLAWPTAWDELFGRSAPLLLEIGFGNGEFLVDLACRRPEANLIGVEISLPSIKKAESKASRLTPGNVQIVHGDARLVLWGALAPESLADVYINFPDPWHKTAHNHRKLINDDFLIMLASRMPSGAGLHIATDDPGYQEVIANSLERSDLFFPADGRTFVTSDPTRLVTKYEQKALREGRTPHYYNWVRSDVVPPDLYLPPQEFDMPHAVIKSSLTLDEIAAHFSTQRFEGEIPVRLLSIYKGIDPTGEQNEMLLVEVHIVEDPAPQRLAFFIQAREAGEILIGVHELGFPRPTGGVHVAVSHLARWVLSLDEGMALVRDNLNCGI